MYLIQVVVINLHTVRLTVEIQICWDQKNLTDPDLHCLLRRTRVQQDQDCRKKEREQEERRHKFDITTSEVGRRKFMRLDVRRRTEKFEVSSWKL